MRIVLKFCAILGLLTIAEPALAASRILSERFDDWFYRCVEAGDKTPARCEVVQIAQTKQGEETINLLTLSVSEGMVDKKKSVILTMLTPVNVYLPSGLQLAIDKSKMLTLQYRNCNNAGCWIQHVIDNKTLSSMKESQSGMVKVHLINGQNLNIKFSLKGFKNALEALQAGKKPQEK